MDWALLLDFLLQMLQECYDDDTSATDPASFAIAAKRNPLRVRAAVTTYLLGEGHRGRELRQLRREIMDKIDEASDAEAGLLFASQHLLLTGSIADDVQP